MEDFAFKLAKECCISSLVPQIFEISGIGPVLIERSRRAQRMNITVKPVEGVRVAVPPGVPFSLAKSFVLSKKNWMLRQLARIKRLETEFRAQNPDVGEINIAKAKRQLKMRLNQLAVQYHFKFNKLFVRNQRTRWGSCSIKNNINLNIKLVRLPEQLIDYVILHELVHTKIKDHQAEFWTELNKYVDNAPALSRKLNRYKLGFIDF